MFLEDFLAFSLEEDMVPKVLPRGPLLISNKIQGRYWVRQNIYFFIYIFLVRYCFIGERHGPTGGSHADPVV